jgi:hypothetical protein
LIQQPPPSPVIVKIISPEKDTTGLTQLRDVLIGSLGLTGTIVLMALVLGAALAGVMFWVRHRSA